MKLTCICHYYNEEYLLPYWIEHHKRIFDNIIFIDHHSTDRSNEIILKHYPKENIITSINKEFNAKDCDEEVIRIEWATEGYKIALTITEFLVGNVKKMIETYDWDQYLIPVYPMIDSINNEFTELEFPGESLVGQRMNGIDINRGEQFFLIRKARSLHLNMPFYPTGRHFTKKNVTDCLICWYGYSPFNESIIKRKLQIQDRIPESDRTKLFGIEHLVDRNQLISNFRQFQQHAEDLTDIIYPKLQAMYE